MTAIKNLLSLIWIAFVCSAAAQVKIGTSNTPIHSGAMLELESSSRGFSPPNIYLTGNLMQLNGVQPADGMLVFNTNALKENGLAGIGLYSWHDNKWNLSIDALTQTGEIANTAVTPGKIAGGTANQLLITNSSGTLAQWTSALTNRLDVTANITLTNSLLPVGGSLILNFTAPFTVTTMAGASFVPITSANTWVVSTANTLKDPQGSYLLTRNTTATIDIASYPSYSSIDYTETGTYEFSSATAMPGYLLCNGAAVSRTTYADLFLLTGTAFGTGDGSTTFNLPDFRGRLFGVTGTGTGLTARAMGAKLGEENHVLTAQEMPVHTHFTYNNFSGTVGGGVYPAFSYNDYGNTVSNLTRGRTSSTGGDAAHTEMQPTVFGGNVFIKY